MNGIVVGVDGSETSAAALRWALREAELRHLPVTAVMAWGYLDQRHAGDAGFTPGYQESDAASALEAAVSRALGSSAVAALARRVVCDRPAPALLEASERADLLVVGNRGLGGFRGLLLGSVSQHCLHHARTPLAIVHAGANQRPRTERIVVGIDGSETARRALQWAAQEARLRSAGLDVLHAWQAPVPFVGAASFAALATEPDVIERAARRALATVVDGLDDAGLVEPVRPVLTCGGAAWSILDASADADLIVVGSRGLGGFAGLLLGSTSQQVATHAHCPVVVIPPLDR